MADDINQNPTQFATGTATAAMGTAASAPQTFTPNENASLSDIFGDFENYLFDKWTRGQTSAPAVAADSGKLAADIEGMGLHAATQAVAKSGSAVQSILANGVLAIAKHIGISL